VKTKHRDAEINLSVNIELYIEQNSNKHNVNNTNGLVRIKN